MKKTVIIAIVLIYLASILVVGFFGAQLEINNPVIYPDAMTLTGVAVDGDPDGVATYGENPDGTQYFTFVFTPAPEGEDYTEENIQDNPNKVVPLISFDPENTTNQNFTVTVLSGAESDKVYLDEETNTIVFLDKAAVAVLVESKQNTNLTVTFLLQAK